MKEVFVDTLKIIDAQLAPKLGFDPISDKDTLGVLQSRYFVESHFLAQYFDSDVIILRIDSAEPCTLAEFAYGVKLPDQGFMFQINAENIIEGLTGDFLQFIYFGNDDLELKMGHGLMILDSDLNVVYLRTEMDNPITEWKINELANDLCDEDGGFVFDGEPIQL